MKIDINILQKLAPTFGVAPLAQSGISNIIDKKVGIQAEGEYLELLNQAEYDYSFNDQGYHNESKYADDDQAIYILPNGILVWIWAKSLARGFNTPEAFSKWLIGSEKYPSGKGNKFIEIYNQAIGAAPKSSKGTEDRMVHGDEEIPSEPPTVPVPDRSTIAPPISEVDKIIVMAKKKAGSSGRLPADDIIDLYQKSKTLEKPEQEKLMNFVKTLRTMKENFIKKSSLETLIQEIVKGVVKEAKWNDYDGTTDLKKYGGRQVKGWEMDDTGGSNNPHEDGWVETMANKIWKDPTNIGQKYNRGGSKWTINRVENAKTGETVYHLKKVQTVERSRFIVKRNGQWFYLEISPDNTKKWIEIPEQPPQEDSSNSGESSIKESHNLIGIPTLEGDIVKIMHGSGIDSGKIGVIVKTKFKQTNGGMIPDEPGAYKPQPTGWISVKFADGHVASFPRNRLERSSKINQNFNEETGPGAVSPVTVPNAFEKKPVMEEGFSCNRGGTIYKDRQGGQDIYWIDNKDTGGKTLIKPESLNKYLRQGYEVIDLADADQPVTENQNFYVITGKSGPMTSYFCSSETQGEKMIPNAYSMAYRFNNESAAIKQLNKLKLIYKGIVNWNIETVGDEVVNEDEDKLQGKFVNRGEVKLEGGVDYDTAEKIANYHWDIFGSCGKDERGVWNFKTRGDRWCCSIGMLNGQVSMLNVTTTPGRLQLLVGSEVYPSQIKEMTTTSGGGGSSVGTSGYNIPGAFSRQMKGKDHIEVLGYTMTPDGKKEYARKGDRLLEGKKKK